LAAFSFTRRSLRFRNGRDVLPAHDFPLEQSTFFFLVFLFRQRREILTSVNPTELGCSPVMQILPACDRCETVATVA
jgi:hypothetical protein